MLEKGRIIFRGAAVAGQASQICSLKRDLTGPQWQLRIWQRIGGIIGAGPLEVKSKVLQSL